MKNSSPIQVAAGDLKPALTGLAKVVSRKPTTPILGSLKAEILSREAILLTGTDLDFELRVRVKAEVSGKRDPFLVPLAGLQQLLRNRKAAELIAIEPHAALEVDKFPELAAFRASPMRLEPAARNGLLHAFECASSDATRYVLKGAYLDVSKQREKAHRIVGTDGRHLFSQNSIALPALKESVIIPSHKVWSWREIQSCESRWELRVSSKGKNGARMFRVDAPGWSLTGRCVEGNYPNYKQVLPPESNFKTKLTLKAEDLGSIAHTVRQLPGKKLNNQPMGMRIGETTVGLLTRESEEASFVETGIPHASQSGPEVTVYFNRDYLLKALKFGLTEVDICDDNSPIRFRNPDAGSLMIVMPLRPPAGLPNPDPKRPSIKKAPQQRQQRPARPTADDPIEVAASQLGQVRTALKDAVAGLNGLLGNLRSVKKEKRQTDREIRSVRSTLRSLKKLDL
ncbi:MAG: DNA polymerase III sliding clamp (beta) subunit (PCNA family) [Verrucomicrobiales bacterium]|jgi:DNA polymerase III sliding clamp (beta) subunit (PCNA family)